MGLPKITFIRKQGIGAVDLGNDSVSGKVFYNDTLPAGFAADDRIKKIFSLQQAESLGIVDTFTDETPATSGNVEITTAAAENDVETITIDGVLLGSYTIVSGDDADAVAVGLRAAINALTKKHGFIAAGSTANVALTPPAGMGIVPNTAVILFASTGTGAATETQFSSGVGSDLAVTHYHISEFFRTKPDGVLYVGIFAEGTFDATELVDMQDYANGEIRQFGIFVDDTAFASSQLSAIQTVLETLRTNKTPAMAVFHADMDSLTLATLPDLSTLTASKVAVALGEDGNYHQLAYSATKAYVQGDKVKWLDKTYICTLDSTGQAPYDTDYFTSVSVNLPSITGYSVSTLGNLLGTIASAPVNQSIAYVEAYPVNSGNILDAGGFATGALLKGQTVSLLNTLNDYHYVFLRKFQGLGGTFYNDSYTAISKSNDYATIENNRVIDKVERGQYSSLLPKLNAPLVLQADGTLRQDIVDQFQNLADLPVEAMEILSEVSAREITIDPSQDVLTNSKLVIVSKIVPVGVAREIEVNNSFIVSIN